MTRTAECRAKLEWVCEHCEDLSEREIKRLTDAAKVDGEYKEITGQICPLSTNALTPLIRETDPEIRRKAIEKLGKQLNKSKKPTAVDVAHLVEDTRDGKDHGGRPKADIVEGNPGVSLSDFVNPVEPDTVVTDPEEATESVETYPEAPYPYAGEEDGEPDDIPALPDEEEGAPDAMPEPVVGTPDIKKEEEEEEITAKVVKEYLVNAGHEDPKPKPKPRPTEENKQAIFDKCILQALVWGMEGDEIARRMRKAITYVDTDQVEKLQKSLGAEN